MPHGASERSLGYHLQTSEDLEGRIIATALPGISDPNHLEAHSSSLFRRRSAPNWAAAPAARQLAIQTAPYAHLPNPNPPPSQQSARTPSSFGAFASQTGIPMEANQCSHCNKVLKDERGLK